MTKIVNGVNIPGPIIPYALEDSYPTHEAIYGKGGWKSVDNIDELINIPSERLENGCIARVIKADNYGNSIEFYYDDTILDTDPDPDMSENEKKAWEHGFRKWTPGYLPTKVSELINDEYYVSEIVEKNPETGEATKLDPDGDDETKQKIDNALSSLDPGGIFQEMARAYLWKNQYTVKGGEPIHGLVTVQENQKILSELLLENSTIYVEMLEGFFPDDFEDELKDNNHPEGMSAGMKYFITDKYQGIDPSSFKFKVATAQGDSSWLATDTNKWCIYVNKAQNALYYSKHENTNLEPVGRKLINFLGTSITEDLPEDTTDWDKYALSAEMGVWLRNQISSVSTGSGNIGTKLDQEIKDRKNADDVIRRYTVNSIQIQNNPVINGSNASLTGYNKGSNSSNITSTDTINAAFGKLENKISNLTDTVNGINSSLTSHTSNKNNPHTVTKDQLSLGTSDEVKFAKVSSTNGFFQTSDKRLKKNINEIDTKDREIKLVQFQWKDNNKTSYGVIADEVEKIYPEVVDNSGDYKTVDYIEVLILKIAELEKKIVELQEKIGK